MHYQFMDKLDTYAGLMLGMSSILSGNGKSNSGFSLRFYIGTRYYISINVAGFTELGSDNSYLRLGISFIKF